MIATMMPPIRMYQLRTDTSASPGCLGWSEPTVPVHPCDPVAKNASRVKSV